MSFSETSQSVHENNPSAVVSVDNDDENEYVYNYDLSESISCPAS